MHVTALTCWRKLQAAGLDVEVVVPVTVVLVVVVSVTVVVSGTVVVSMVPAAKVST